ncbi:hypothetical protein D3C76_1543070 [compost metagenome]
MVGEHRAVARRIANAQGIQRGIGIRAKLDAGTDFTDVVGLLQQQHLDTLGGQGLGSGKATDAAADDDDFLLFGSHGWGLRTGCVSYWMKSAWRPGAARWKAGWAWQWSYTAITRG